MDSLLSATGRADVPVTLAKALHKASQDNRAQLAELAEIGALRDPSMARGAGRILSKFDQITRLVLDDTYKNLGPLVEQSETARREFVNQAGQYNRRAQGLLVRYLRDTGFGPFVTAGKTFNVMALRMATLSPGVKASSMPAAVALRANALMKWVGFGVALATLNYLLSGKVGGRPGVPIGNLDTGKTDKAGHPMSLPIADLMGLGRSLRLTGARGFLEGYRRGLTRSQAVDQAARDIINTSVSPMIGPAPRFASVALTGRAPAIGVARVSPVALPGQNQLRVNLQEALKDANPIVKSALDLRAGKPGAIAGQFPRFALQPGKTEETAAKFSQIVGRAEMKDYVDYWSSQARKLPRGERFSFIQRQLRKDGATPKQMGEAMRDFERKGTFKYQ
jgi:hypothetical protein